MFSKLAVVASLALIASAVPVPSSQTVDGPGIMVVNAGKSKGTFCFFENHDNGNGWAIPEFNNPNMCLDVAPGQQAFQKLASTFKGRVQKGKDFQATWGEFQLAASDDNKAHGDVSIEQGCDVPVEVMSTDGSNRKAGFVADLVSGAPAAITNMRQDGVKVLKSTMGNWLGGPSKPTADYARSALKNVKGGEGNLALTYIEGGSGIIDVASANQALKFIFH